MKNKVIPTCFALFISIACYGQSAYTYKQPEKLNDGWKTNSLKSQKVDTARIYQLFGQLEKGKHKIHSVLLVKNGRLIIEDYFNGHSANKLHDLRSTTKKHKINSNGSCN